MATGALFGDRCYASQSEAVDAFFSGSAPVLTSGSTSYLTEYTTDNTGIWFLKSWAIDSNGLHTLRYTVLAEYPTFPTCEPTEYFVDGVTIGWGIATAMILALCIKFLWMTK
ncbi:MAG: hypothetical protein Q7J21_00200 [Rugosibacter sp.]|nr:hypothetical protein [Rugosibacter sp.]